MDGRRGLLAAAVALLMLLSAGPAGAARRSASPDVTYVVSGHVTNSKSAVLVGWTVTYYLGSAPDGTSPTALTDSSGNYTLNVPAATGTWRIELLSPDSVTQIFEQTGTITAAKTMDLVLSIVADTVTLVDGHGNPVVGATIAAQITRSIPANPLHVGDTPLQSGEEGLAATTDASGVAVLDFFQQKPWHTDLLIITPPPGLGLGQVERKVTVANDTSVTVVVPSEVTISGVVKTSKGAPVGDCEVEFFDTNGFGFDSVLTASDGSYSTVVPSSVSIVDAWTNPDGWFLQGGSLVVTGDRTLDLTIPMITVTAVDKDTNGQPVAGATLTMAPSPSYAEMYTPPMFPGATGPNGTASSFGFFLTQQATTDASGHTSFATLQSLSGSSALDAISAAGSRRLQVGSAQTTFAAPTADQTVTVTQPIWPQVVPGEGEVTAPTPGTVELDVPVTLTQASTQTVTASCKTVVVGGGDPTQAPASDYTAVTATVTFTPGQTTADVPIVVSGDSTGVQEYVVVSCTNPTNAYIGGFYGLGFGLIDAP
jgi:hypothetical protein